jgi:hypothetical protein
LEAIGHWVHVTYTDLKAWSSLLGQIRKPVIDTPSQQ